MVLEAVLLLTSLFKNCRTKTGGTTVPYEILTASPSVECVAGASAPAPVEEPVAPVRKHNPDYVPVKWTKNGYKVLKEGSKEALECKRDFTVPSGHLINACQSWYSDHFTCHEVIILMSCRTVSVGMFFVSSCEEGMFIYFITKDGYLARREIEVGHEEITHRYVFQPEWKKHTLRRVMFRLEGSRQFFSLVDLVNHYRKKLSWKFGVKLTEGVRRPRNFLP